MARVAGVPFSKLPRAKQHAIVVAQRRQRATPAENLFCCYLASLGLSYRFQQRFYAPCYRIADFYLPSLNVIIEIGGPCHDPDRDRRRDAWFEQVSDIRTLRITDEQVLRGEFEAISKLIDNGSGPRCALPRCHHPRSRSAACVARACAWVQN